MRLGAATLIGLVLFSVCAIVCCHRPQSIDGTRHTKLSSQSPATKKEPTPPGGRQETVVLVENLGADTKDDEVKKKAEELGPVVSVEMRPLTKPKGAPQSAYIRFEQPEAAKKAVAKEKKFKAHFGKDVTVKIAPVGDPTAVAYERRVTVKGLPPKINEAQVKLACEKCCGKVIFVRFCPNCPGATDTKQVAYVFFESPDSVKLAVDFAPQGMFTGVDITVNAEPDGPAVKEDVDKVLKVIGYDFTNKAVTGAGANADDEFVSPEKSSKKNGASSYCPHLAGLTTVFVVAVAVSAGGGHS